jgi:hypothetical protein
MKNKIILILFILTIVLILVVFNSRNGGGLKIGKYVYSLSDSIDYSWIELSEDNTFIYSRGQAYSYRPTGKYEVQDDELILYTSDGNVVFKIIGNKYNMLEILEDPLLNTNQKKLFKYEESQ